MADYYTHLSCVLDVGSPENAARALELYRELAAELEADDEPDIGFMVSISPEPDGAQLWIRDEVSGDPEHVIRFVQRCASVFGLKGRWGFQWAYTCSRPRTDGFGGGAHVLNLATGKTAAWVDTDGWLAQRLSVGAGRRRAP